MTIWIFAILLIAAVAVTGLRQGAIRASISTIGIIFGALFAGLAGIIFKFILPHMGVSDPIFVWMLAPICGFILINILFKVAAFKVFTKIDVFYRYKAGDLRLAMWERLDSRLGVCVGVLNGSLYFILIGFVIFNLSYWTAQAASDSKQPSILTRLVNQMGHDLESTGMARSAAAVHSVNHDYYRFADLAGLLLQNPQLGGRFATYPGLTSLWQRDDMQPLANDGTLTNCLASDATLGDILNEPPVQDFLKNKDLIKTVTGTVTDNWDDFTNYLQTGVSAKYANQKFLGTWQFNIDVSAAWFRQSSPNMTPTEMASVRALWSKAYSQTTLLFTGDGQVFIDNLPKFNTQPGQPPGMQNWKGTWTPDGTLDIKVNDQEKFLSATAQDFRLTVKDGRNLLIFDRRN